MRKSLAVALIVVGVVLTLAAPARAHAVLASSDPSDGEALSRAPSAVTLTFTEVPDPRASRVEVLDREGARVSRGAARPVDGDAASLRVGVGTLAEGVYTVTWRVLSTVDGHVTGGAFAFGVGRAPTPQDVPSSRGEEGPRLSLLAVIGRWAILAGIVLLLGGAISMMTFLRGRTPGAMRSATIGWPLTLVGVLALAESQRQQAGVSVGDIAGTTIATSALWRVAPLMVAGAGLILARRAPSREAGAGSDVSRPSRRGLGSRSAFTVAVLGGLGVVVAHVLEGHAGVGRLAWAKQLAQAVHVVAAAVWIGGLAALLPSLRSFGDADARARAVRGFSSAAAWALLAVAATGTVRAFNEVGSLERLTATQYGRLVLAKIALLLVLAALGAVNRYRHVATAGAEPARLRRIGRVEIGVGAIVLVATAVLAGIAPGRVVDLKAEREPTSVVVQGSDFGTTVRARLEITPGTAGPNRVSATVLDYDSRAQVDATRVELTLRYRGRAGVEPLTVQLEREGAVWVAQTSAIALAGPWDATLLVQQAATSVEIDLPFRTRAPPQTVSTIPGDPTLYDVAIGGGRVVQLYVDPSKPGRAEVHATFFERGAEIQSLEEFTLVATTPEGEFVALEPRKLSAGHVVATVTLTAGRWRFDASARAPDGRVLTAYFEPTIEP